MKIWYLSQDRFTNRIVKDWKKSGFKYNAGNVQLLRFSFRAVQYWSNLKRQRISKANKIETFTLKLF